MNTKFPYRLYLVLSEESCPGRDFTRVAEQAIRGGVDIIQLREKKRHRDTEEKFYTLCASVPPFLCVYSRYLYK